ncbi:uncharacterized protein LOC128111442 [Peromyscus californicus insignis]|uniref:uncharacterized protein LOC128111442 n=1 Tax=Peromyscus californicus insignis TaxID=564181 RepID=UPI0022A681E8|nr:uncharacterized protein LOC128111442 [Peromyscus californicus insignis]
MTGDKKDLIPRKCSTNLPTRCGTTIGLPTGFPLPAPVSFSVAATLRCVKAALCEPALSSAARSPPSESLVSKRQERGESRTARVENGNSYVVRERGGRRKEEAREEGGAGLKPPPPPPGAAPERASVQLLWASTARLGIPGSGSPEDASVWSSLQAAILPPAPSRAAAASAAEAALRPPPPPAAAEGWQDSEEAGEEGRKALLGAGPRQRVEEEGCTQITTTNGHPPLQGGDSSPLGPQSRGNRAGDESWGGGGDGNEPMWSHCGLGRTAISHQLFPVPGASRVSLSLPPREG